MRKHIKHSENAVVAKISPDQTIEIYLVPLFVAQPATWLAGHYTVRQQAAEQVIEQYAEPVAEKHQWLLDDELAERTAKNLMNPNRWHETIKTALKIHKVTHVVAEAGMKTTGKYLVGLGA